MPDIVLTVFTVAALLGLVSLLLPLAERLAIPYAVMLAAVGIAIGIAAGFAPDFAPGSAAGPAAAGGFGDIARSLQNFGLSAEALLTIFVPALLFEAALNVDVRQLSDEIAPVLLLAIVGVLVCTFVVGLALWPLSPVGFLACLSLGAIIATTDPVAVVGIFRDIGAPRRLSTLVEGEALFNDAAAIAIYAVALTMLVGSGRTSALGGVFTFVREFGGGLILGYLAGQAALRVMSRLRGSRLAETTLTIGFAYIAYIVSEHAFGLSGVVTVAAAAITIGVGGRRRLSPSNWESLVVTWEQLAFWASSLIFLFAAMKAPYLLRDASWRELLLLGVMIVAALGARALTLYGLLPVLSLAGVAQPIYGKYKIVMLWGGMRGAVSLALALAATENEALPAEIRQFIGVLATGFVLFTLVVNAPTLRPLMRLLNIDRLGPAEIALRDRAIGIALSAIREEIAETARQHHITAEMVAEVAAVYGRPATAAGRDSESAATASLRVRTALSVLADREQEFYLDYFEGRTLSRRGAATLLAHAARLRDGTRSDGIDGYRKAAARLIGFDTNFRLAHALHRRLDIAGPLAQQLSDRFEVLLASRVVVEKLIRFNQEQIGLLFGGEPQRAMAELLDRRLGEVERAISALRLQYPAYLRQLGIHFLGRIAARIEDERYQELRAESIVNRDVFDDLQRDLKHRRRDLEIRPALDLGLDRAALVARVPMFAALDMPAQRAVASMLRPRLAVPAEVVVRKGARGDAMYFISSGAVEVRIAPEPVQLGSGDFFGEMALLVADRRTADVAALGYCQLLTLAARDLDRLFATNPAIRDSIHETARARTLST